jgi:hypothetical protein
MVIESDVVRHPGQHGQHAGIAVPEQSGPAEQEGCDGVELVVGVPDFRAAPQQTRRADHGLVPKSFEPGQAILGSVPSDDRACHRPNGSADDPLGIDCLLQQMLVSAGQIGAERIASAEHQDERLLLGQLLSTELRRRGHRECLDTSAGAAGLK